MKQFIVNRELPEGFEDFDEKKKREVSFTISDLDVDHIVEGIKICSIAIGNDENESTLVLLGGIFFFRNKFVCLFLDISEIFFCFFFDF